MYTVLKEWEKTTISSMTEYTELYRRDRGKQKEKTHKPT